METLGVDLRTRVKRLGAKEKARRKNCKVRFSLLKKNEAFQKSYMNVAAAAGKKEYDLPFFVHGSMNWRSGLS